MYVAYISPRGGHSHITVRRIRVNKNVENGSDFEYIASSTFFKIRGHFLALSTFRGLFSNHSFRHKGSNFLGINRPVKRRLFSCNPSELIRELISSSHINAKANASRKCICGVCLILAYWTRETCVWDYWPSLVPGLVPTLNISRIPADERSCKSHGIGHGLK